MRAKLVEEFQEQVPSDLTFNVGYFEGQSHSKISLVCNDDLDCMYAHCNKKGEITLWCDSRVELSDEGGRPLGKRRKEEAASRRQEKEEEVDEVFEELMEAHHGDFSTPQLRLWARMIASHLHDDRESPPNIPAFGKSIPKRSQQQSFSDAISGAAVAFAQALKNDHDDPSKTATPTHARTTTTGGLSPVKVVDLRMKNFEQLRYLQQLYDDGVLSLPEYTEQKEIILCTLRNLSPNQPCM